MAVVDPDVVVGGGCRDTDRSVVRSECVLRRADVHVPVGVSWDLDSDSDTMAMTLPMARSMEHMTWVEVEVLVSVPRTCADDMWWMSFGIRCCCTQRIARDGPYTWQSR